MRCVLPFASGQYFGTLTDIHEMVATMNQKQRLTLPVGAYFTGCGTNTV